MRVSTSIAGLPLWQGAFGADGTVGGACGDPVLADVRSKGITDLVIFAHGWNNDQGTAMRLYQAFFSLLAGQLPQPSGSQVVGLAGVLWPSELWPDEPTPTFAPAATPPSASGTAGLAEAADTDQPPAEAELDQAPLDRLHLLFPAAAAELDAIAALLKGPVTSAGQVDLLQKLKAFS